MVGRGSFEKATEARTPASPSPSATETHAVPADSSTDDGSTGSATAPAPNSDSTQANHAPVRARALGSPPADRASTGSVTSDGFTPERGQTFLQVAAVGPDEAEAIADVLHKKGFRAHAVPKPGNPKFFRVLIGPIRDTADLSSTRDSLRKTGFREVIVQKYQ